jgi:hypothetical protein
VELSPVSKYGTFCVQIFPEKTRCFNGFLNFFNAIFGADVARKLQQSGRALSKNCRRDWGTTALNAGNQK